MRGAMPASNRLPLSESALSQTAWGHSGHPRIHPSPRVVLLCALPLASGASQHRLPPLQQCTLLVSRAAKKSGLGGIAFCGAPMCWGEAQGGPLAVFCFANSIICLSLLPRPLLLLGPRSLPLQRLSFVFTASAASSSDAILAQDLPQQSLSPSFHSPHAQLGAPAHTCPYWRLGVHGSWLPLLPRPCAPGGLLVRQACVVV